MSVALIVIVVLVMGVILVNGWTDAPNAIATVVSTRSMSPGAAIIMAAIFNFLGVFFMTMVNSKVAQTITNMADFGSGNEALVALAAALVAIVVFATAASKFGIPTSESHALIAGVTGAAIAIGGFSAANADAWIKVIYGLGISSLLGFVAGYISSKGINFSFRRMKRKNANSFFTKAQIASGASMAFLHGAQDGQKFMGIFMLGIFLAQGQAIPEEGFKLPIWMMILCSVVMGIGTSIGGYSIIKAVGMDMVKLEKHQGFAADFAASACLLLASLTGVPVSTTHTKTTAIMGVGSAKRLNHVNWGVAGSMISAWIITFPVCGLIGFFMAKVFTYIF